ncbi:MAG: hypothetical protein ACFFGZ_01915 [Candidatus Thorarchaeota archaeon]
MGRRNDQDLVEAIVNYLKTRKGVVTQGQLCSTVGINSKTAEKWLAILHFVLTECPKFTFGKAGRYGVVSVVDYEDLTRIRTLDEARQRVEPGSLQSELTSVFKDEKKGLAPVEASETRHRTTPASSVLEPTNNLAMKFTKAGPDFLPKFKQELAEKTSQGLESPTLTEEDYQRVIVISEKVKPVLRCSKCGEEQSYPSHCGEPMELTETEFVCTFRDHCGEHIPIPRHCGQRMAIVITGKGESD